MAENTNNNTPQQGAGENTKKKRFRSKSHKKVDNYVPNAPAEVMAVTIEELELSEKTYNALQAGGVLTVGDIIKRRMTEMYKIKNIGKKDCIEIQRKLAKYNVTFREEEPKTDAPAANDKQPPKGGKDRQQGDRQPQDRDRQSREKDKKKGDKKKPKSDIPEEPIDKDELVKFYRKKKWGFKDWQGKEVIPPEFDEAFPFREDLACVEKDEKLGYINKAGEIVIPFLFDSALSFSEGLASVTIGEYSGYIDKTGEYVFPLEYESATSFMDGKAIIRQNGRWGFLTKDGNIRWK